MAPFDLLWPNEFHGAPTQIAYAIHIVYNSKLLTSSIMLAVWLAGNKINNHG